MIPTNLTKKNIEFYKMAKKHDISMTFSTEKLIEVVEEDKNKIRSFVRDIKKASPGTQVTDLIANRQVEDVQKRTALKSKALYLTDDDYYERLINSNGSLKQDLEVIKENQLSLF